PRRHPLFAGLFDSGDHDLVINVGNYDLGDYNVRENFSLVPSRPYYKKGTRVVRFSLDADAIGRNNAFSLAFLANVKLTLQELLKRVKGKARPARKYRMKELKDLPHAPFGQAPMHPDELGYVLEEMLDRDAIVVSENLSGPNQFFSTGFRKDEKMWVGNTS